MVEKGTWLTCEGREMHKYDYFENLKGRDLLKNLGIDGR